MSVRMSVPMTIYSLDRAPVVVVLRPRRRSWFARFIVPMFARFTAAVYRSRMHSAQVVIARHRGFMPIAPEGLGDETKRPGP